MNQLGNLARKLEKSFSTRGVSGTVSFIVQAAPEYFKQTLTSQVSKKSRQPQTNAFDQAYEYLDTGGSVELSSLAIDNPQWKYGIKYQAVVPGLFDDAISSLEIDYSGFSFIDIGSGKGRALLLAAGKCFKEIIGVELSEELHQIALKNIAHFPVSEEQRKKITSVCQDALSYPLPETPLVIFMYHPFVGEIMEQFLDKVKSSMASAPRKIYIVYTNDVFAEIFTENGIQPMATGESMGDSWSTYKMHAE